MRYFLKIKSLFRLVDAIKLHGLDIIPRYLFNRGWSGFPYFLINGLWALPLVLMSRVLRPIFHIKFGEFYQADRIGHFISDGLEEVIRCQKNPKKSITFWGVGRVCNYQWLKMLKKELFISSTYTYLAGWNKLIPGARQHSAVMSQNPCRDVEGKFYENQVKLQMSSKDVMACSEWLSSIGWKGQPFICLLSRDSAYLNQTNTLNDSLLEKKELYSYHSYRDSDIETFELGVNFLLEKGYWVFRMGSIAKKELIINHNNFYDYAFSPDRSDLLDIYLFSNCTACISTGTGIDALAGALGTPLLMVNFLPLGTASTFYNVITVPKNLFWIKNNKSMTLKQYIENSFFHTNEYTEAGIKIKDLRPEEILNAIIEFVDRIENTEKYNLQDQARQNKFLDQLRAWSEYNKYHGFIHPNFKIGKDWLSSIVDE